MNRGSQATEFWRGGETSRQGSSLGLSPELLDRGRKRLAGLAGMFSALALIAVFMQLVVFQLPVADSSVIFFASLTATSGLLIWAVLSRRLGAVRVMYLGLAYMVVVCWATSFFVNLATWLQYGHLPPLTWVSIIIVIYPTIIPMPPRTMLWTSALAASSGPASVVILREMGMVEADWRIIVGHCIDPTFAVMLAWYGARVIHRIRVDVSKARKLGAYTLETRLGEGGMGEVWRAQHAMLARPAAVKLIAPSRLSDNLDDARALLSRFEQEAQTTATLRSPHTVEIYDFGTAQDGSFYYVMELLDGLDLQDLVDKFGPLPAGRVVHLLLQACHSLGEAHVAGLVHRDVKPANIFTCRYGQDVDFVKILDFGLVKTATEAPQNEVDVALTQKNSIIGTPAFMPPELARGEALDGRADLYALGCVAYWLLCGQLVFDEPTSVSVISAHLFKAPPAPSTRTEMSIPADLERVVLSCLAKDPADRPADAYALARELRACQIQEWTPEDARSWWDKVRPSSAPSA